MVTTARSQCPSLGGQAPLVGGTLVSGAVSCGRMLFNTAISWGRHVLKAEATAKSGFPESPRRLTAILPVNWGGRGVYRIISTLTKRDTTSGAMSGGYHTIAALGYWQHH